jgi:hypothetical protein
MELKDVLTVAIASLIVLVVAHLAVFYVVKTLYPPAPVAPPVPASVLAPVLAPVYTPPAEQAQYVSIPTVAPPVPVEAPREEEPRRGPPPPEATSIHGTAGVDPAQS